MHKARSIELPLSRWGVLMMSRVLRAVCSMDDAGATAVEYAIMAGFIAVVIAGSVALFGQAVLGLFQRMPVGVFGA